MILQYVKHITLDVNLVFSAKEPGAPGEADNKDAEATTPTAAKVEETTEEKKPVEDKIPDVKPEEKRPIESKRPEERKPSRFSAIEDRKINDRPSHFEGLAMDFKFHTTAKYKLQNDVLLNLN